MIPDLRVRMDTVVASLREVVIPALPADEALALEQAEICMAQLTVLAEQYRYEAEYQALCLDQMIGMATTLLAGAAGGPVTTEAAAALRSCVESEMTVSGPTTATTTHRRRNAIAMHIDTLLRAAWRDGTEDFCALSARAVVEHGSDQARRDRVWFRGCGMDPESTTLGTITDLFHTQQH